MVVEMARMDGCGNPHCLVIGQTMAVLQGKESRWPWSLVSGKRTHGNGDEERWQVNLIDTRQVPKIDAQNI